MNEEQIQELKNLVDKLQEQGLSTEEIQAQVDLKKQEFQKPDFQTPTTPGAVVEETAAPDTESKSEDGFLVSPSDVAVAATISSAPGVTSLGFKATKSAFELFKGVPEFFKMGKETIIKSMVDMFSPEELNEEQKNAIFDAAYNATKYIPIPGPSIDDIVDTSNAISNTLEKIDIAADIIKYDNPESSILEDFKSGNINDAIGKTTDGVVEAIPSVIAATSGIGGLAVIGTSSAGSNYEIKTKLDPSKRGDLTTTAISIGQGGIELFSEMVTRGLLKGSAGLLKNFTPNAVKNAYKSATKTLVGKVFTASQIEAASETAAQEANRKLDFYWDNEKNLFQYQKTDVDGNITYDTGNIVERVFDTWLISSLVGGGIGLSPSQNTPMDAYAETKLQSSKIKKENAEIAKQINTLADLNKTNPDPLIEKEISELQDKIKNNKILNREVLESFESKNIIEYAKRKVALSESKEKIKNIDFKNKEVVEKIIQKEESKLEKIYNDQLDKLIKALEKPIVPKGALVSDFGISTTAELLRQAALKKATEKKVSNDVQKIYEEKGEGGALDIIEKFRPITNKLVRKRKDAPNYDEQLLRDEIETGERGIFDLIRSYNPESGVPLSGYINKFLPARAIEASKRVLGEQFTQDVTEIKESKIEIDDTTQETLDFVRTEPEAKEQLRDVAGITKESVQADARQILKGKLPGILEKSGRDKNEILTAINKASQLKIADAVLEEMGGNFSNKEEQNSRFITFMDVNFEATIKAIPNSVKNKLPLFEAKQVDRETMAEGDEAGKGIFEYKNPTRDEFIKYYTEGGLTTLRAKKKKLADILAQEIGKDAIAEVLSDPQVQKEFLERQELLGKEIPQDAIPKLLQRIDRYIQLLEKPIRDPGTLATDFGTFILDGAREIALQILKGIRKALKKGLTFNKAKKQAITEASSNLGLDSSLQKKFVNDLNKNISLNDVLKNNIEKNVKKVYIKNTQERFSSAIKLQGKRIKQKLNSNINKDAKINELFNFFKGISQVYQKSAGNIVWKGQKAKNTYDYWSKELNINLKDYGFTIIKSGRGEAIAFKGEKIFDPVGRPSNIANWVKDYENIVDEMDVRSEYYKSYILSEIESLLETEGIQQVMDFISVQGFYSDSPLRLVGKLRKYEKNKNKFKYEHTPPIKQIQTDIYKVLNSNFENKIVLNKISKILNKSKVDLISPESINKIEKLGRKESGSGDLRYQGVIDPKNLIEIKRPEQKIKEETDKINLNKDFNNILEQKTGIASEERYIKAKAEIEGKGKGAFDYIGIPPSAQDFMGLLYKTLGKGKLGDAQLAWYKKNLLDPFAKAMIDVSNYRVTLANNYKGIKKEGGITSEILQKKLPDGFFTVEQAIRAYIWNKQEIEIEGLEKNSSDLKQLIQYIKKEPKLATFANRLILINKKNKYPEPDKNWLAGTIATDLLKSINTNIRKDALAQWKSNVDIIFNETNMNKLEAAFGKGYRSALDNMLKRMESGRNRGYPGDQLTGRFVDWINGSVGAIMFFNMRSAVLQTISSINFINFTDNNPLKAAAAFANQPQFWKDVMFIMNSDFLVERRNGLKINVSEADIAEIAAESDNKAKAFVNKILKLGFLPTQIADSFAIATGGASFYRNRIESYIKKGLSEKEAQEKAFIDFREITEENQQSSRPDRISQQQAGPLGRIILAFANTPAQYARIIQRAASDLKNGRGDAKTNISKIIYYGAVQNVIFNAMQQALFAIAFGNEEPDDEKEAEKYGNIVNGMVDSLLRGTGFAGAAVSTVKNAIIKIAKDGNKQDVAIDLINISPPISSKIRKVRSAGRTFDWNKKEIKEKGLSLDNPAAMAVGQLISATTNIPLDRGLRKLINIKDALDTENEEWMRIANALGWAKWELEWEQDKRKKKKQTKTKIRKTF
jgi:Fe-S cluster biosynthesis and repair protein YggX